MAHNSLTPSPPSTTVQPGTVIKKWDSGLRIEVAGNNAAVIAMVTDDERTEYGTITWHAEAQAHAIRWNEAGLRAFTMRSRDALDDEIYDAMDRWHSQVWLAYQEAQTYRILRHQEES